MHIAIIPTMDFNRCIPFLVSLIMAKVKPDEVYIVNNSGRSVPYVVTDVFPFKFNVAIGIIDKGQNIGPNASWNIGMEIAKSKNAHLSIFNDDIVIKQDFFERLKKLLEVKELFHTPVFVPSTVRKKKYMLRFITANNLGKESLIRFIPGFEGWAFTIRNSVVKEIPPIPEEFFIFLGDDWIWKHSIELPNQTFWAKDERNLIYHHVGLSLKENPDLRKRLIGEKRVWNKMFGKT